MASLSSGHIGSELCCRVVGLGLTVISVAVLQACAGSDTTGSAGGLSVPEGSGPISGQATSNYDCYGSSINKAFQILIRSRESILLTQRSQRVEFRLVREPQEGEVSYLYQGRQGGSTRLIRVMRTMVDDTPATQLGQVKEGRLVYNCVRSGA